MNAMLGRLPWTRLRIAMAKVLYRLVHLVYRQDKRVIERSGISYEVDLSEGIDLAVFLFGNFQRHVSDRDRLGPLPTPA